MSMASGSIEQLVFNGKVADFDECMRRFERSDLPHSNSSPLVHLSRLILSSPSTITFVPTTAILAALF